MIAAAKLHIAVQPVEVQGSGAFGAAFAAMVKGHAEALVLFEDAMFASERSRLAALAAQTRLPAIYGQRNSVTTAA